MNLETAEKLMRDKMAEHGLTGWRFQWTNAKCQLGCCYLIQRKIKLSRHLVMLNSDEEITDTMLHEIAHALHGEANHGREWKAIAKRIGAKPRACATEDETIMPQPTWKGICENPDCHAEIGRWRLPRKPVLHTPCWRAGKPSQVTWQRIPENRTASEAK